jgi:hypothetical protein
VTGKAMNWARVNRRARMWRQGVESVRDDALVNPLLNNYPRGRRPKPTSKAELRAEAARAFMQWRARHGSKGGAT